MCKLEQYRNALLEEQEEYETRVLVFQTQFKNGTYTSDFINGFSAYKFVGTRKGYDDATAIFYKTKKYGKIIGTMSYTFEEWNKIHKPKEVKKKDSRTYLQFIKDEYPEKYQEELERERRATRRWNKNKDKRFTPKYLM